MAITEPLTPQPGYVAYFQERILRGLEYWRDHAAIRELKVAILDRERETILTVIALGLEFPPAWPLVKQLIVALTPYMERRGHWEAWHGVLQSAIVAAQHAGDVGGETTLTALLARLSQRMSRPAAVVTYYRRRASHNYRSYPPSTIQTPATFTASPAAGRARAAWRWGRLSRWRWGWRWQVPPWR